MLAENNQVAPEKGQDGFGIENSPTNAQVEAVNVDVNVITQEELDNLYKWNIGLAAWHGFTGACIAGITKTAATVPVYTFFANTDRGKSTWGPTPKKQYDDIIGYLAAVFLFLACIDHLLCATLWRDWYEDQLRKNQNHFRWFEYAFSASFMHVMIAQLSGIMDLHLLFTIYVLCFTTMIFGSEQERVNADLWGQPEKKTFRPFWYGFIPHVGNWLIIICHFFYGVTKGSPPAFVWAIIFILLILDSAFAVNMYLQQSEYGNWKKYIYGEWVFCILSLSAKQLLAWLNWGGTAALGR